MEGEILKEALEIASRPRKTHAALTFLLTTSHAASTNFSFVCVVMLDGVRKASRNAKNQSLRLLPRNALGESACVMALRHN